MNDDQDPVVTYPDNSNRGRERRKEKLAERKPKVEPVITGKVIQRDKSLKRRILETFTPEDTVSVRDYVIFDVIIPSFKDLFYESWSRGMERLMFGNAGPSRRVTQGYQGHYTAYNKSFRRDDILPSRREPSTRRQKDWSDIVISSRGEAEDVLDAMADLLAEYDMVTVADLYDLLGMKSEFTDDRWGWSSLRSVSVSRVSGGYLLNLPDPRPVG